MQAKSRRRLANGLIGVGVLLLTICVGYMALTYPWRVLMAQMGMTVSDDLPEPAPLATSYTNFDPSTAPQPNEGELVQLPAESGMFSSRPKMDLTLLGSIKIPKLGLTENIVEGSGQELFYGVGHVIGTAFPGQEGNCVLAGHRNYIVMRPFRYLDKVAVGDKVQVSDDKNRYTYEIYNIFTVTPDEVWVAEPQEGETAIVTLITCTPVMNPTHRLIYWGRLVETTPLVP